MGKTIVLLFIRCKATWNILDVGENFGVIYNLSKDIMDEISVDYVGVIIKVLELNEKNMILAQCFFSK